MVVEDELMRIAPQIPPGLQLTLRSQPSLAEALGDNQLDRDLVEQAFGQLAAMAEGDSPRRQLAAPQRALCRRAADRQGVAAPSGQRERADRGVGINKW